ncbi:FMN-binding protein [Sulfurovum sp. zt1-1]|uniref:FMN-binding protein n=1 Tax=Sulfurovum zhangzhouensis TaxID=3019067 RepID=A0ABT7QXP7_9BACT|nr:FMN-binding protein [Sulfurovum zhangzhouensis]MDM5271610.1 FMN-binding protein [Sulfurovum zhangzhouensis]
MKKIFLISLFGILFSQSGMAKTNVTIESVIKSSITNVTSIEAKQLVLTKAQYDKIKQTAKAAVRTKIYRYYTIMHDDNIIGYGVLITRKVRTKKATVLYAFDNVGKLMFSEIMVFGEPPEYVPNKLWMKQFDNVESSASLTMGKDIPTISGATLSARAISDGARIARAIFNIVLKK